MSTPVRITVAELAALCEGSIVGDGSYVITGVNTIQAACATDVSFLEHPAYRRYLADSAAGCLFVRSADVEHIGNRTAIVVSHPHRAFVAAVHVFNNTPKQESGMRWATATIHPGAVVHPTASIGPGVVVSDGCVIGEHAVCMPNVVLYENVVVGANTLIHANVSICHSVHIGERCIIHAGATIGSDGFGYLENAGGSFEKIPQIGTVVIGNDVEIGANSTIDRAAVGATVIEDGVKIDNLVHIAHGVHIGENTAIAAQTGVSGSTTLGKRNRLAGQVGVVGHITTADDVIVYAQSGVGKDVVQAGVYFGSPIKERGTAMRIEACMRRLPEAMDELRQLQNKLNELIARDSE